MYEQDIDAGTLHRGIGLHRGISVVFALVSRAAKARDAAFRAHGIDVVLAIAALVIRFDDDTHTIPQ